MEKKKEKEQLSKKELMEDIDFYLEKGYLVFTEKFLRERGYCCQNGCRHCPYGFKKDKNTNSKN